MSYYAVWSYLILFALTCSLISENANLMQIAQDVLIWPWPFAKNIWQTNWRAMQATTTVITSVANNMNSCSILIPSTLLIFHLWKTITTVYLHLINFCLKWENDRLKTDCSKSPSKLGTSYTGWILFLFFPFYFKQQWEEQTSRKNK